MKLPIEPITPANFAPYGVVIRAPEELGRITLPDTLSNLREGARATLSVSRAAPTPLPMTSQILERHRYSSQTFLPLDVARYLAVVAPETPEGVPDPDRARGFIVGGDTGITYNAGSWHHAMIVLDRPGCLAVVMWREETPEDMDTIALGQTLEIPAV